MVSRDSCKATELVRVLWFPTAAADLTAVENGSFNVSLL